HAPAGGRAGAVQGSRRSARVPAGGRGRPDEEDRVCCFSGDVRAVSATKIFARGADEGRQILVYQATLTANAELAMILPLPTPADAPEGALRFVSLLGYETFF